MPLGIGTLLLPTLFTQCKLLRCLSREGGADEEKWSLRKRQGLSQANTLILVPQFFTDSTDACLMSPKSPPDFSPLAPSFPLTVPHPHDSEPLLSISSTPIPGPSSQTHLVRDKQSSRLRHLDRGLFLYEGFGSGLGHETTVWHLPVSSARLAFQHPVPSLCTCLCSHLRSMGVSHLSAKAFAKQSARSRFCVFLLLHPVGFFSTLRRSGGGVDEW